MAMPIKETPVLKGKEAKRFFKRASEVEEGKHKESPERLKKINEICTKL
ncbi:hypothetical protein MCHI_000851 [Candidatus Magnetoovum chiemensis]|nr:hypothetical protein MCHI_000851 [Candidatus Magnetoovum chiemensis]